MSFLFGSKTKTAPAAPTTTPQVEAPSTEEERKTRRIGRQSLIATSPAGVLTTAPVGRRKLLGN